MRDMRRKEKLMSNERTMKLLGNGMYCVLSVFDGETPYGIPMNYAHAGGSIYLHGSTSGHKIEAMITCPNVCLTIVGRSELLMHEMSMDYESVVVFGKASFLTDKQERQDAMRILCKKYCVNMDDEIEKTVQKDIPGMAVIKVDISSISGKGTPE